MKAYEFGDESKPVILLLPGTCYRWKATFGEVVSSDLDQNLSRYKRHFANSDIRAHALQHEELLVCYPQE